MKRDLNIKFLLTFLLLWNLNVCIAYPESIRIAVFKSRDLEPYNAALATFEKTFKDKGYDVQFLYYDLGGRLKEGQKISNDILNEDPKLIFTLGTEATKVAKENISDIPVVFSVVLDPIGNGFVERLERSGTNLAGVTLDVPVKDQFKTLISVLPEAERIGVVYDPQNSGRIVEEAARVAERMGLDLVKVPVFSKNDVPGAIESLKGRIDVLWAPVDNTVYTPQSAQYILLFTLRNKIPFMAFSDNLVKAGAIMGLRSDYEIQGEKAAILAIDILKGKKPSNMPIAASERFSLFLNQRVADLIGVGFSPEIVRKAEKVYK